MTWILVKVIAVYVCLWAMYLLGHAHGYKKGRRDAFKRVESFHSNDVARALRRSRSS